MSEQTIVFGGSRHLIGTITLPDAPVEAGRRRTAVLLTNAGVISRIGPRRLNVKLARRLAQMGLPCLRWDMSGLGDSQRPGVLLPQRQQFISDAVDAMNEAAKRLGVDSFVMIGFCSGAEIAFRLALQDPRLKAVVLFDHHIYRSRPAAMRWYRRRLRETGIGGLPLVLASAVERGARVLRERLRAVRWRADPSLDWTVPTLDQYARHITSLLDRGVDLLFLYSGVFPHVYNHGSQFGELYGKFDIPRRVTHEFMPDVDHLVTAESAQVRFIETVTRWVLATSSGARSRRGFESVEAAASQVDVMVV